MNGDTNRPLLEAPANPEAATYQPMDLRALKEQGLPYAIGAAINITADSLFSHFLGKKIAELAPGLRLLINFGGATFNSVNVRANRKSEPNSPEAWYVKVTGTVLMGAIFAGLQEAAMLLGEPNPIFLGVAQAAADGAIRRPVEDMVVAPFYRAICPRRPRKAASAEQYGATATAQQ